jgi:hypothetical protein
MTQWKDKTRGGNDYRITARDPSSDYPIRGEAYDSGFTVRCDWNEDGRISPGSESPYDLIPIETEANPAKARVDLALAAMAYKRACDSVEAARESAGLTRDALVAAVKQRGRNPVVVKIDGLYFLFEFHDTQIEFSEIEVL